jgi:hypothetical protein
VTIGFASLEWPPSLTHTISAVNCTENVYGQVWIDGVTGLAGATPGLAGAARGRPDRDRPGDVAGRGTLQEHSSPRAP